MSVGDSTHYGTNHMFFRGCTWTCKPTSAIIYHRTIRRVGITYMCRSHRIQT